MATESTREETMKTNFGAILGLVFRRLRREKEKTQVQVAMDIGVTQTHYAKMEQGRVNTNMFKMEKLKRSYGLESIAPIFEEVERLKQRCVEVGVEVELRNTPLQQTDDLYGERLMVILMFGSFLQKKEGDK